MPAKKAVVKPKKAAAKKKAITTTAPVGRVRPKAKKAEDCPGVRKGSFERQLRFATALLFGPKNTVRMQEDFKVRAQEHLEGILITILVNAKRRRTENGRNRMTASNVFGAFADWASVANPRLVKEYARLRKIADYYSAKDEEAEKEVERIDYEMKKHALADKLEPLIQKNIDEVKRTGARAIFDYGGLEGEEKEIFRRCFWHTCIHKEKLGRDGKAAS
jgi:hypothetical protein